MSLLKYTTNTRPYARKKKKIYIVIQSDVLYNSVIETQTDSKNGRATDGQALDARHNLVLNIPIVKQVLRLININ